MKKIIFLMFSVYNLHTAQNINIPESFSKKALEIVFDYGMYAAGGALLQKSYQALQEYNKKKEIQKIASQKAEALEEILLSFQRIFDYLPHNQNSTNKFKKNKDSTVDKFKLSDVSFIFAKRNKLNELEQIIKKLLKELYNSHTNFLFCDNIIDPKQQGIIIGKQEQILQSILDQIKIQENFQSKENISLQENSLTSIKEFGDLESAIEELIKKNGLIDNTIQSLRKLEKEYSENNITATNNDASQLTQKSTKFTTLFTNYTSKYHQKFQSILTPNFLQNNGYEYMNKQFNICFNYTDPNESIVQSQSKAIDNFKNIVDEVNQQGKKNTSNTSEQERKGQCQTNDNSLLSDLKKSKIRVNIL
jgi:hypothetical protein